jgi:malonyl CoA-acyl carrier protein transacylase
MSTNKKPRKAYRPRPVTAHTMTLATHYAAKPSRQDRAEVLGKLQQAVRALCAGVGTEQDWSIAAGAVAVAMAIERQGVVRGLQEHLHSAEQALQHIYNRCHLPMMWLRPTLSYHEADALRLLQELHAFQVDQLGRAEFLAAIDEATQQIKTQGHQVTVVRDVERMAA